MNNTTDRPKCWPVLPLDSWQDTYTTLHMWTQIVGKVRLRLTPLVNHWWNVPLYVTARGLTTSCIPYGDKSFELRFDFIHHQLVLETSDAIVKTLPLRPQSVAEFYKECFAMLRSAGIEVKIWPMPVEIPKPIRFDQDGSILPTTPRPPQSADTAFCKCRLQQFRSRFIGKSSPVHFFWGSFDLAVTRFSGRRAPPRDGADSITREAYSHEVSSVGFWPGAGIAGPAFYSYMAPEPPGFRDAQVQPAPLTMTRPSANSSSCTTTFVPPHLRGGASGLCKAPTKPEHRRQSGTATASNGAAT